MPYLPYLVYPWGILLQGLAVIHFIRRRPDSYWLWIIILGGGLGALVYLVVEAAPDLALLKDAFGVFPRRQRIRQLQAEVGVNPAPANYEELGDLYLQGRDFPQARTCFDRAIAARPDGIDPYYRRALSAIGLGDYASAVPDLESVVAADHDYDFHRAAGLLARAYAQTGQQEKAEAVYSQVMRFSTLTEMQVYYAEFLADTGRRQEALAAVDRLLARKASMPSFQRRRDRPWFRRAQSLRKRLAR